jgi:hypothetical protein
MDLNYPQKQHAIKFSIGELEVMHQTFQTSAQDDEWSASYSDHFIPSASLQNPLDRRLGSTDYMSVVIKRKIPALPYWESNPCHQAHSQSL